MPTVAMDEGEISPPKLCTDCTNILERVEQLEAGSLPVIDESTTKPDLEFLKRYEWFEDIIEFQESAFYKDCLPEDDSLEHKSTRTDLLESADSGCHLCRWLLNSLDSRSQMSNSSSETFYRRRPAVVRKDPIMSPLGMRCVGHYYVSIRCAPNKRVWPVILKNWGGPRRCAFQNYSGDEKASLIVDSLRTVSKESPDIIKAIASGDEGSPSASTWTLLKIWLDLCISGHSECRSQTTQHTDKIIPTRLLDIRDPELVRVVQTGICFDSAETPRYATLSHCWGKIYEPQLNTGNSHMFTKGVYISDLPKTFSDAIIVARKLKIPYLWIDALCILHDSTQDRLKESSKIGSIYRNSYLCIAGTVSKDNSSGFLERRDLTHKRPFIYHDLIIQEDVAMSNNHFGKQITWCDRIRTLVEWGVERGPLNQRAWAVQERMFAPRILHCISDEFVWECCRGMRSESHPLLTNGGSVVKDVWRQLSQVPPRQELQPKHRKALLERWGELIAIYSRAQLTRMDDKLVACSAITKELQPILGSYAAGLWRDYLPTQLLWSHHCGVGRHRKHNMRPRSKPSWSWASIDCRVELPYYYDATQDRDFNTNINHYSSPLDLDTCALVNVLDVNVDLRGEDPTGLVDGGVIRLGCCQLLPLYRSVAFGWRLETEPPDAINPQRATFWSWDDPDDFISAAEQQIQIDMYKPGKSSYEKNHANGLDYAYLQKPDNPEEERILAHGSIARFHLIHKKALVHHIPTLTQMCCLPVAFNDKSGTSIAGLVLEHTGDASGQYRRVGHFSCQRDYLDTIAKVKPNFNPEFQCEWPSGEKYSPEDGYTISII